MQEVTCAVRLAESLSEVKSEDWLAWDGDYREAGRLALKEILEGRMNSRIDGYLEDLRRGGSAAPDRRNGFFERHLLTELGDIVLAVPRTRRTSAAQILRKFKRRPAHLDRTILESFILGCSTRKGSEALLPILGEPVSASLVSGVATQLDAHVAAFHRRKLPDDYRFLFFDGVVLKQKTGARVYWRRWGWFTRGCRCSGAGSTRPATFRTRLKRATKRR